MKSFAIFYLLLCSCALCQDVRFIREDITFELSKEYFAVEGNYWFANPSDRGSERSIYYPFPTTGQNNSVDSVDIFDITHGIRPEISDRTKSGFSFVLTISGHDTVLYHIAYRQKVGGDSAMYILRSTRAWNRPLEFAEYKLAVEDSITIIGFSYHPDKVYVIEGKKFFLWRRTNFMPEKDFVVRFKAK